ncbi:E3 ubiquitin/ISG15 ligase TRIM25-like [Mytilus californianus]|uniref:E3 ubiquitin/ISG15 ligase TRIM25-like n=1 Tax=Mytilus californianus TaxID=6549 RepID=UPI0022460D96|nr:E3 ubiquitin/ISG15 ligase TRIM25-like [Mytilus californianus]
MATNSTFCNICELRHLSNMSTSWCPECEQCLCSECKEHHGIAKILRNHKLIPIEDYKKLPPFISELRQSCQEHNENYQLYCPSHEICICYKCIKCHGKCGAVPLDDMLKDIKTSEMYKDLEQIMTDMLENIREIKNDRHNISDIETEKEKQLEEIRQMRLLVNNHLDKLEEKLKIEIEETVRKTTEKIRKTIVLVHETEQKISKNIADLNDIQSYASDLQTFLGMKEMQTRISENEKSMQSLLDDDLLQQRVIKSAVDTNIGNCLSELKVFGSVEILTKQERLSLRKRKNKQAQLLAVQKQQSIQDITLNQVQTMTSNGGTIRGCCVTTENHLLLTLHSQRKLSLMDFHGSCLVTIPIEIGDSYDVTFLDDNHNVAVTSGKYDILHGINIIHLPPGY